MQDHTPARTGAASRPTLREELTGPPRPSGYAHAMTIGFGLLLTASLVIGAFTDSARAAACSWCSRGSWPRSASRS